MEVKSDNDFPWKGLESLLPGAVAVATNDYGESHVFDTCPHYAVVGGHKGRWFPSCLGQSVSVSRQEVGPTYAGGGTLIVRESALAAVLTQKDAHEKALSTRAPVPSWKDLEPRPELAEQYLRSQKVLEAIQKERNQPQGETMTSVSQTYGKEEESKPKEWSPMGETLACIGMEVRKARKLHPGARHKLAALMEEVGELAQALIDHDRGKATAEDIYLEAIQVASTAVRVALEGSEEFSYTYSENLPVRLQATRFGDGS